MPFREKTAWVMMILLIGLGVLYGQAVIGMSSALGETAPPNIGLIAFLTVVLVVGAVLAHILMAVVSPSDANAPEDERDKLVIWRAGNLAGYVLGFGVFAGLWHFFIQRDGNMLFHILAGSLIISQISEYALSIIYYRRSWAV